MSTGFDPVLSRLSVLITFLRKKLKVDDLSCENELYARTQLDLCRVLILQSEKDASPRQRRTAAARLARIECLLANGRHGDAHPRSYGRSFAEA